MIYTTWTTIATLINVTIVLTYDIKMSAADAATVSYTILAALLLVWYVICKHTKILMSDLLNPQWCSETMSVFLSWRFMLEQLVYDKHMRYILVIYPVVIWALSGNLDKNYDAESPDRNGILIGMILRRTSYY